MPLESFSLAIVGVRYPNKRGPTRRFEIAVSIPGEPIELRLEPKNKADPHAVAVYSCRGVQMGYLTAERAPMIGALIRQGVDVRAIFQNPTRLGGVIRVATDGNDPDLPPEFDEPGQAPDFWPDEEWPDE